MPENSKVGGLWYVGHKTVGEYEYAMFSDYAGSPIELKTKKECENLLVALEDRHAPCEQVKIALTNWPK